MRPDPNHAEDTDFSVYEAVRHHEVIAHALEAVEAGLIRRLIINCPPRHGKSELASRLFPAWYIGRNVGESIIQASYNEKFSWDFGREVRQIIEDRAYRQVFPKVQINTASVDRVETMSGSKLFSLDGAARSLDGGVSDSFLTICSRIASKPTPPPLERKSGTGSTKSPELDFSPSPDGSFSLTPDGTRTMSSDD